jgi:hypothetical protein
MHNNQDISTRTGLLATGSSGRWSIDVDEALDRGEWFAQIESPEIYLIVQLRGPDVILEALQ